MCGIFGRHKNHKITTDEELKELNLGLIEQNKGGLKSLADLKVLRKKDNFEDYISQFWLVMPIHESEEMEFENVSEIA